MSTHFELPCKLGGTALTAIYEIYKDTEGQFRFWLISERGKLLLRSKAYRSKRACRNAVASARRNASALGRFERKTAKNGKAYFVLKSANHRLLGRSELYGSLESLDGAIESVRMSGPSSPINELSASWHR